jgi:putative MATE family efflux protein
MPLFLFSLISRNIFHASGDTIRPLIFTAIAQLLNVVLDPFLIFGWWIFPEMGVGGAATATVICSGIGALLALWYFLAGKTAYRVRWRHAVPRARSIMEIYRVGFPSFIMEALEGVIFAIFNHVAAGYGSWVLAAMGVATRIYDLAFMPVVGASHGLLPIIGFSLGAKLWDRLWQAVRLAASGIFIFLLIATVILEIFTPQIIGVFNSDPELLAIAVPGMRIFSSTFVFFGLAVIFVTTFQGLSKGREALILNLARQFVYFIPGLFILSSFFGLTGVWISMPVSDVLGCLTSGLWLWREYRMHKRKFAVT